MAERLPSITPQELIRTLERAGLRIVREGSRHTVLWKEGLPRTVTVPRHRAEMRRGLLADIIKQAGLTQEEFRRHLK